MIFYEIFIVGNNNYNNNNNYDDDEDDDEVDAGGDDHHLRIIRHTSGTISTCYLNNANKNCSQQQQPNNEQNLNELKNIKQEIMTSAVAVVEEDDDDDTTEHLCNLCPQVSTHHQKQKISIVCLLYAFF